MNVILLDTFQLTFLTANKMKWNMNAIIFSMSDSNIRHSKFQMCYWEATLHPEVPPNPSLVVPGSQ